MVWCGKRLICRTTISTKITKKDGISGYRFFLIDKKLKNDPYYYIDRKGEDAGFIQVAIKLKEGEKRAYYIKTVYISYKIK